MFAQGARPARRPRPGLPRAGLPPVARPRVPATAAAQRADRALHAHALRGAVVPRGAPLIDPRGAAARDARRRRARVPGRTLGRELPAVRARHAPRCARRRPSAPGSGSATERCSSEPIRCRWIRNRCARPPEARRSRRSARTSSSGKRTRSCSCASTDLELSKNIVRGFQAFETFLHDRPDWHGKVRFLALLPRSRTEIPEYQVYGERVREMVEMINAKFGGAGWQPHRGAHRRELRPRGRGVRHLRHAAREPDLRRDEPRRDGGAAREPAAGLADPVAERRRVRASRPPRARGEPVRRRRDRRGDRGGARDAARGTRPACARAHARGARAQPRALADGAAARPRRRARDRLTAFGGGRGARGVPCT